MVLGVGCTAKLVVSFKAFGMSRSGLVYAGNSLRLTTCRVDKQRQSFFLLSVARPDSIFQPENYPLGARIHKEDQT